MVCMPSNPCRHKLFMEGGMVARGLGTEIWKAMCTRGLHKHTRAEIEHFQRYRQACDPCVRIPEPETTGPCPHS